MTNTHALAIGFDSVAVHGVQSIRNYGDANLDAFNIIIWNAYSDYKNPENKTPIGYAFAAFDAKIRAWVNAGGLLILPLYFDLKSLQIDQRFAIQGWWASEGVKFRARSGQYANYIGVPCADQTDLVDNKLQYQYTLQAPNWIPVFEGVRKIHSEDRQIVACAKQFGSGGILIIPYAEPITPQWVSWSAGVLKCQLKRGGRLPLWVDEYVIVGEEARLANEIADLVSQRDELDNKIAAQRAARSEYRKLKAIFSGTDDDMEIAVEIILNKLGFLVAPEIRAHVDRIAAKDGVVFCIEVKGHKSGITREAISSVHTWMAELDKSIDKFVAGEALDPVEVKYIDRLTTLGFTPNVELDVRGLIVVTGEREIEPHLRTKDRFEDNQRKHLNGTKVAAIKGIDLLGWYVHSQEDVDAADELISRIFKGGVVDASQHKGPIIEKLNDSQLGRKTRS